MTIRKNLEIAISLIGAIGGILIASGSGLVSPFSWIIDLGVPAQAHLPLGTMLSLCSIAVHVFLGGNWLPFRE